MSNTHVAFLACPADLDDPGPAVNWLLGLSHAAQANFSLFVAATVKFKAPRVQTLNVGANYPPEFAKFLTLAGWAVPGSVSPTQFYESQALMCLRQFIRAHPGFRRIVLVHNVIVNYESCEVLLASRPPKAFTLLSSLEEEVQGEGAGLVLMDRDCPYSDETLDLALDIALCGAIYGLEPYNFGACINHVTNSLVLARSTEGPPR